MTFTLINIVRRSMKTDGFKIIISFLRSICIFPSLSSHEIQTSCVYPHAAHEFQSLRGSLREFAQLLFKN
jgi:hypothetical protein